MRLLPAALLGLAACAAAPEPAVVSPGPVLAPGAPRPAPQGCKLQGAGELHDEGRAPFHLFAERASTEPALEIERPSEVAVGWTITADARAAVTLGGQRRVRGTFYAELGGRAFQLRQRARATFPVAWLEPGAAVEVRADEGGLFASRESGAERPARFEAAVRCGDLAYEPAPVVAARPRANRVELSITGRSLHVAALADGPTEVVLLEPRGLELHRLDAAGERVRVEGRADGVGFVGWVPAGEVRDETRVFARCYHRRHPLRAEPGGPTLVVEADTPLLGGAAKARLGDAVLEAGAAVWLAEVQGALARVELVDGSLTAPGGLWVRRDALP